MAMLKTGMVNTGGHEAGSQAYFARPDDGEKHPGVVMIQEWWGLEPHIKDMANKLAVEGFVVIVPDFYNGAVATEPDDAGKSIMMIVGNVNRAINMVQHSMDWLKAQPEVEPKQLGIIGFCVGGYITYLSAERLDGFAAVAPFYAGGYDPTPESVASVDAPVFAVYGDQDGGIPMEQVHKIEKLYKDAGKDYELHVYHAGHAFLNPDHGMGDAASAKDVWPKAVKFLREHLTPAK